MPRPRSSLRPPRLQEVSVYSHKNAIRGLLPAEPLARWTCSISKKALLDYWPLAGKRVGARRFPSNARLFEKEPP